MSRRVRPLFFLFGFFALFFGVMTSSKAHMTSMGRFFVKVDALKQKITLVLSISRDDVGVFLKFDADKNRKIDEDELQALRGAASSYFASRLLVSNNGLICAVQKQRFDLEKEKKSYRRLVFVQEVTCQHPLKRLLFQNTVMFDDVGGYQHIARIQVGTSVYVPYFSRMSSRYVVDILPHASHPKKKKQGKKVSSNDIRSRGAGWFATLLQFVFKGSWHILIGFDHLVFIFCLLLAARNIRHLLGVVTSFTVGHSITLILCVMDLVYVPVRITESLIALTIAYVGIENLLTRHQKEAPRFRFWLTGLFGLIHGFGFSYILRELHLPKNALVPSLMGFNIGIELAQIGLVMLVYPFLYRMMRSEKYDDFVLYMSGATTFVALYWFVTRAFF